MFNILKFFDKPITIPQVKSEILSLVKSADGKGVVLASEAPRGYHANLVFGYPLYMNFPAEFKAYKDIELASFTVTDEVDFFSVSHPEFGNFIFNADVSHGRLPYVGQLPMLQGLTIQLIYGDSNELAKLCTNHHVIFFGERHPAPDLSAAAPSRPRI